MSDGFQLSLPGFAGPVEALPPLVAAHRLDVDDLPLAEIAAQFLAETQRRDGVDLEQAGEVLSAVARLMLLKSLHLLAQPGEDEEEPLLRTREPAADIALVREAAQALGLLQGSEMYSAAPRPELVPKRTEPRSPRLLVEAWEHLHAREARKLVRAAVPAFVRLEVAVSRLVGQLRNGRTVSLVRMLGAASRRDVVVHFLAALELVRRGQARAEQDTLFGDITLEWARDDESRSRRAG